MAEDAHQPRTGVRDRRIHPGAQELRRACHWTLRRREADVCSAHAQRFHANFASRAVQEAQAFGNSRMPVHESSRKKGRTMGRWFDSRENGGMQVAEAGVGWTVRVR